MKKTTPIFIAGLFTVQCFANNDAEFEADLKKEVEKRGQKKRVVFKHFTFHSS